MGSSAILGDIPPAPLPKPREDHPEVQYWSREDFTHTEAWLFRETSGDVLMDDNAPLKGHSKYYLLPSTPWWYPGQQERGFIIELWCLGTLVYCSGTETGAIDIQQNVRQSLGIFFAINSVWSRSCILCWCNNGECKVREWCTQNYSLWAFNVGLQQKKMKNTKTEGSNSNPLDDIKLIHMQDKKVNTSSTTEMKPISKMTLSARQHQEWWSRTFNPRGEQGSLSESTAQAADTTGI